MVSQGYLYDKMAERIQDKYETCVSSVYHLKPKDASSTFT